MPSEEAQRNTARTDSAPRRWPSTRGSPRSLAQRPFPSMMMATCAGRAVRAFSLSCVDARLMRLAKRPGLQGDGL